MPKVTVEFDSDCLGAVLMGISTYMDVTNDRIANWAARDGDTAAEMVRLLGQRKDRLTRAYAAIQTVPGMGPDAPEEKK